MPLALRLLFVVETVKTDRRLRVAKKIVKYTVFPCMHVKESVSA